jgi:hypothetical protein
MTRRMGRARAGPGARGVVDLGRRHRRPHPGRHRLLTYYGWRIKPDQVGNEAIRLNHVAFGAIAALLGIQAPAP